MDNNYIIRSITRSEDMPFTQSYPNVNINLNNGDKVNIQYSGEEQDFVYAGKNDYMLLFARRVDSKTIREFSSDIWELVKLTKDSCKIIFQIGGYTTYHANDMNEFKRKYDMLDDIIQKSEVSKN